MIERREKERIRCRCMHGQERFPNYGRRDFEVTDFENSNSQSLVHPEQAFISDSTTNSLHFYLLTILNFHLIVTPRVNLYLHHLQYYLHLLSTLHLHLHPPLSGSSSNKISHKTNDNDSIFSPSRPTLWRSRRNWTKNKHAYGGKGNYSEFSGFQRNERFLQTLEWNTLLDELLLSDHATFITSTNQ